MGSRPALALGTVQFGLAYGITGTGQKVPDDTARAILKIASAAGVIRLDTAAAYGDIEERLAGLICDLPFTVVSKIPALPSEIDETEQRAFVEQAILRSHNRLGELMVGILFHDASPFVTPANDSLWDHAANLCARLGLSLGMSGYDPDQMTRISERLPLAMAQLPGNAFDQRIALQRTRVAGCETTLRSIFLQGLLLVSECEAPARLPAATEALMAWREWCAVRDLSFLDGAIAIAQAFPADYCVVGVDGPSQFEAIAEAWHRTVPTPAPDLARNEPAIIDPRAWPEKGMS